ncbi:putative aminoglycoside phosphotransferase protein [Fusarium flagelliforme]|uniref:Putative aminoglycoside phosphotransferase protein n=1 Tax=Fusarium flagelliforme TaxID=2675880 RepID=A0A395MAP9_9HYPO|nr:putative aminoglycoside phosphotransferase protein [Fusarium flagelliforme]
MDNPAPEVKGVMQSIDPLPIKAKDLTASWFTTIFERQVKEATIIETIHGTASKVFVKLTFNDDTTKKVCVKGGLNPAVKSTLHFMLAVYRLEAEFYYNIAPTLNMALPRAIYAGTDTVRGQGLVVFEDLKAQGYSFGNPLEPWPVSRVEAGVKQLATLHAGTWGNRGEDLPSLAKAFSLKDAVTSLLSPEEWDKRFDPDTRPPVPVHLEDQERIMAAFETLWRSETRMKCLIHGYAHIGNTFISPTGEPGFLDWQVIHPGSAMTDVAYFIIGSLSIDDRRLHEKELLLSYLEALNGEGGPEMLLEDVWGEYRRQAFHGFAWAVVGPMMPSREIIDAMTERHCAAIVDHKSIELLEGLIEA